MNVEQQMALMGVTPEDIRAQKEADLLVGAWLERNPGADVDDMSAALWVELSFLGELPDLEDPEADIPDWVRLEMGWF